MFIVLLTMNLTNLYSIGYVHRTFTSSNPVVHKTSLTIEGVMIEVSIKEPLGGLRISIVTEILFVIRTNRTNVSEVVASLLMASNRTAVTNPLTNAAVRTTVMIVLATKMLVFRSLLLLLDSNHSTLQQLIPECSNSRSNISSNPLLILDSSSSTLLPLIRGSNLLWVMLANSNNPKRITGSSSHCLMVHCLAILLHPLLVLLLLL
jgi:hypothetical protein